MKEKKLDEKFFEEVFGCSMEQLERCNLLLDFLLSNKNLLIEFYAFTKNVSVKFLKLELDSELKKKPARIFWKKRKIWLEKIKSIERKLGQKWKERRDFFDNIENDFVVSLYEVINFYSRSTNSIESHVHGRRELISHLRAKLIDKQNELVLILLNFDSLKKREVPADPDEMKIFLKNKNELQDKINALTRECGKIEESIKQEQDEINKTRVLKNNPVLMEKISIFFSKFEEFRKIEAENPGRDGYRNELQKLIRQRAIAILSKFRTDMQFMGTYCSNIVKPVTVVRFEYFPINFEREEYFSKYAKISGIPEFLKPIRFSYMDCSTWSDLVSFPLYNLQDGVIREREYHEDSSNEGVVMIPKYLNAGLCRGVFIEFWNVFQESDYRLLKKFSEIGLDYSTETGCNCCYLHLEIQVNKN